MDCRLLPIPIASSNISVCSTRAKQVPKLILVGCLIRSDGVDKKNGGGRRINGGRVGESEPTMALAFRRRHPSSRPGGSICSQDCVLVCLLASFIVARACVCVCVLRCKDDRRGSSVKFASWRARVSVAD